MNPTQAVRTLCEILGHEQVIEIVHQLWQNPAQKRTDKEVEAEFKKELHTLLARWDAELDASDHWIGYSECGEDVRMTVEIRGTFSPEHETIRESTSVDLGCWVDKEAHGQ